MAVFCLFLTALLVSPPSAGDGLVAPRKLDGPKLDGDLHVIEAGSVRLSVPALWDERTVPVTPPLYLAEVSGLLAPAWHDGPVMTTVFLVKLPGDSLEDVVESAIEGYTQNPDRVFAHPPPFGHEVVQLASGQEAHLLHLRFFRTSKGLQQSRWDLIIYSSQDEMGYFLTMSVQHVDETFAIEEELHLADVAERFFSGLILE